MVGSSPEKSFGKKQQRKPGGFKLPEVGIEGGERDSSADGKGSEVGIHPDLGRGRRNGCEFQSELAGAWRFFVQAVDVAAGTPPIQDLDRLRIGISEVALHGIRPPLRCSVR